MTQGIMGNTLKRFWFHWACWLFVLCIFCSASSIGLAGGPKDADLLKAAEHGNLSTVKELLKEGAQIDAQTPKGWRPLHMAAYSGSLDVVQYLVSEGADIEARNEKGCTPIHAAAVCGKQDVVVFLAKSGAKVSVENVVQSFVEGHNETGIYLFRKLDQKMILAILFPVILALVFISINLYKWLFVPRERPGPA